MWSILASLYPSRGDNCSRVNKYKEHEDKLDMDGMKYPVRIQDINKFERLNNISVSVFAINEDQKIFPLRITTSKDHDCHHVDLLYITDEDGETSHYTLIRDLSRLVSPQINKHNGKMFICNFCLHACQSEEILKRHKERCSLHNAQRVKLPQPGKNTLQFNKIECQLRLPFTLYADFESILIKNVDDMMRDGSQSYTTKYEHHKPCSYALHTVSSDKRFCTTPKIYFGENSAEHFLDTVLAEEKKIRGYLSNKIPMKTLTETQLEEFNNSETCHICEKKIKDDEKKIKDHDHLTGKIFLIFFIFYLLF